MPTPSPAATAISDRDGERLAVHAATVANIAVTSAVAPPTERSNWPAIRSIVAGQAMIPTTDEAIRMLMKLSVLKKYGDLIEKKIDQRDRGRRSARPTRGRARGSLAREPAARPGSIAGGAAACGSPIAHPAASAEKSLVVISSPSSSRDDRAARHDERRGRRPGRPPRSRRSTISIADRPRRRARASIGRARRGRRRRRRASARS